MTIGPANCYQQHHLQRELITGGIHIPFSFDRLSVSVLDKYRQRIAVWAVRPAPYMLYLPVQIVDECVGSIHIVLCLDEDKITVWMHKVEETCFNEFEGFFEGVLSS